MAGLAKKLKSLFLYKPKPYHEFELLEGKYEGVERENTPEARSNRQYSRGGSSAGTSPKTDMSGIRNREGKSRNSRPGIGKKPLAVDEWNKQKNDVQNNVTQSKDTQNNGTQNNDAQNDDTQNGGTRDGGTSSSNGERKDNQASPKPVHDKKIEQGRVSTNLAANLDTVKREFGLPANKDIIVRQFRIARKKGAFLVYIDGMVDRSFLSEFVIRQLMNVTNFQGFDEQNQKETLISYINENIIAANETSILQEFEKIYYQVLCGDAGLFVDGTDSCLIISSRGFEKRSVSKPLTENVVMGSQEAFTENLRTNLSLVRKIIKNKNLVTETFQVGKMNQSTCSIMYVNGIVNPDTVREVKRRISSLDSGFVMGDGMLSQLIEDNTFSILPQTLATERPDRTASFLAAGKVAIIAEGTPFAEIVPITFYHFMQTSEDATLRWQYGTFLRIIRLLGLLVTVLLPAMYIALTLFHQEMIPTELLSSIVKAKENVPFPTIVEVLLLEVSFELIREGGIRIPGVIGQTLGIIGALILGQAAVAAGLVSPILIIIVAVTGLGSFAIPNYPMGLGLRVLRFFFIFIAAVLGFYGISLAAFFVVVLACSMKSFGVPFLSPVGPKTNSNPDLVIREPIWRQEERPDFLNPPNKRKQAYIARKWKLKRQKGDNT